MTAALVGAALMCMAPSAAGDPIKVTEGLVTAYSPPDLAGATLAGLGLALAGDGVGTFFGGPTTVGAPGNLDGFFAFRFVQHPFSVVVNGVSHEAFLSGSLTFLTDRFITPPPTNGTGDFRAPFTMTGRVQGFGDLTDDAPLLFDVDLEGIGIALSTSRFIEQIGGYLPLSNGVQYNFTEAVASTPEPASLLLLGTGAAGLLLRRRRR